MGDSQVGIALIYPRLLGTYGDGGNARRTGSAVTQSSQTASSSAVPATVTVIGGDGRPELTPKVGEGAARSYLHQRCPLGDRGARLNVGWP